jgi:CHAD domain-containing protein
LSKNPNSYLINPKKEGPEISLDDPVSVAGKKLFGYQLDKMIKNEVGTKTGKRITPLHEMRVATRRLRVAFHLLGRYYDPGIVSEIRSGLKVSGKALGRVRDYDVLIERLDFDMMSVSMGKKYVYEFLRNTWYEERKRERKKMLAYLNSESYRIFKQKLIDFVDTPEIVNKETSSVPLVCWFVPTVVFKTIGHVQSYNDMLGEPSITQLHEMRIAIKELRYTLKFFCNVLGDDANNCIIFLKEMQNHLGEINDTRTTLNRLRKHRNRFDCQDPRLNFDGKEYCIEIDKLIENKEFLQRGMADHFSEIWDNFYYENIYKNLNLAISTIYEKCNNNEDCHENFANITSWEI